MCPRSVALPRFSRTQTAKPSNFSYSECCTTGHRPPHLTEYIYVAHFSLSATVSSMSRLSCSLVKVINQSSSSPPCQTESRSVDRHAIKSLTPYPNKTSKKDPMQPQIDFPELSYIFSEPTRLAFPCRLSKQIAGSSQTHVRHNPLRASPDIDALTTVRLCKSPNSSTPVRP